MEKIKLEIANRQEAVPVDSGWYRRLAKFALEAEGVKQAELSLALVDDATIHELNRRFLDHDFATDVITFPLSGRDEPLAGEIVVSAEFAARHCAADGWPAHVEIGLYLVHGILHLCGYRDSTNAAAQRMDRRQRELLGAYLAKPAGKRYVSRG